MPRSAASRAETYYTIGLEHCRVPVTPGAVGAEMTIRLLGAGTWG